VNCGAKTDTVTRDAQDTVTDDCETVDPPRASGAGGGGGGGGAAGGGDTSGGGGATPAPDTTGAPQPMNVRVATRTANVSAAGVVVLSVPCQGAAGTRCAGNVTLTASQGSSGKAAARKVTLGKASFSIPAGTTGRVRVKLSRRGRALVKRSRRVRATATLRFRDGAVSRTVRATVVLKPRRR
jgi:hypothetical protein